MKPYDYWLAEKYMEHVADVDTIELLQNKSHLDTTTKELGLNCTMRYLLWRDFESRARQFAEYPGMRDHMLQLVEFIKNGQEELALRAIEPKSKGFRQMILEQRKPTWRK
jgi:hypothetical protein